MSNSKSDFVAEWQKIESSLAGDWHLNWGYAEYWKRHYPWGRVVVVPKVCHPQERYGKRLGLGAFVTVGGPLAAPLGYCEPSWGVVR